jgi:hypothetical protein
LALDQKDLSNESSLLRKLSTLYNIYHNVTVTQPLSWLTSKQGNEALWSIYKCIETITEAIYTLSEKVPDLDHSQKLAAQFHALKSSDGK